MKDDKKLTDWPTVYLVVFVNLNQSDKIDSNEYECLRVTLNHLPEQIGHAPECKTER